eukprot:2205223-Rhodomonas_salina.3
MQGSRSTLSRCDFRVRVRSWDSTRCWDLASDSFLRAVSSMVSVTTCRSMSWIGSGLLSCWSRSLDAASSMRSMALSGSRRVVRYPASRRAASVGATVTETRGDDRRKRRAEPEIAASREPDKEEQGHRATRGEERTERKAKWSNKKNTEQPGERREEKSEERGEQRAWGLVLAGASKYRATGRGRTVGEGGGSDECAVSDSHPVMNLNTPTHSSASWCSFFFVSFRWGQEGKQSKQKSRPCVFITITMIVITTHAHHNQHDHDHHTRSSHSA